MHCLLQGTGRGTECLYFGHNASPTQGDFTAALGLDMWATLAVYMTGHYQYGLSFSNGVGSGVTFINGGGVLLVPEPASGRTPIIAIGDDSYTPGNNSTVLSVDSDGKLHFDNNSLLTTDLGDYTEWGTNDWTAAVTSTSGTDQFRKRAVSVVRKTE